MRKSFPTIVISAVFLAATAAAQTGWDSDGDGVVDEAEFRQNFLQDGAFERWDRDGDAQLGLDEFIPAMYRLWDRDGDGSLSVDEWDRAVDLWLGEDEVDLSVQAWDSDGDGTISPEEFRTSIEAAGLFARLEADDDADELLSEDELASAIFGLADVDEDTFLGEEEDWFLVDLVELFSAPDEEALLEDPELAPTADEAEGTAALTDQPDEPLIERGEAFVQLPVPCGGESQTDNTCQATAERFCEALGYGEPIDFLDVSGQIYAIRCSDEL